TSREGTPLSRRSFSVPPVASSSTPRCASWRAKDSRPVLSETLSKARWIFMLGSRAAARARHASAGRPEARVERAPTTILSGAMVEAEGLDHLQRSVGRVALAAVAQGLEHRLALATLLLGLARLRSGLELTRALLVQEAQALGPARTLAREAR